MTTQELRCYKTIFFDLDGTLLPIDMDTFLREYFSKLKAFADARGYDGEKILFAVNKGVKAMLEEDARANDLCFWETFEALSGFTRAEFEPLLMEFYENDFDEIGETVTPNPAAARTVATLKEKGYQLFLTTMPLFPAIAVEARLRWAGIDDASVFDRITTYDNSHAVKPQLAYYEENIALAAGEPDEILMVGNNTREANATVRTTRYPCGALSACASFCDNDPLTVAEICLCCWTCFKTRSFDKPDVTVRSPSTPQVPADSHPCHS